MMKIQQLIFTHLIYESTLKYKKCYIDKYKTDEK